MFAHIKSTWQHEWNENKQQITSNCPNCKEKQTHMESSLATAALATHVQQIFSWSRWNLPPNVLWQCLQTLKYI